MQESEIYGLECPAAALFEGEEEQYRRKELKLLEYAKICRIGGKDEVVSFVHRRFQEFFVVESIIEQEQNIDYEDYESIVNNSGMRDALVLYCEVAEEEKAKEIARFCWDVIRKNSDHTQNILEDESMKLVNTLYFMTEAFRNRKNAIAEFKEAFEGLIGEKLNKDTDFVILLAFVNSMVLFDQEYLQQMVLKVFELKNRWLNDVVMQNCRVINRLDNRIETQFAAYFGQMNVRTFLERFRNVQFSLSLSKSFRYIRTIHFMIFLIEMSCIVLAGLIGFNVVIQFDKYVAYIAQEMDTSYTKGITISEIFGTTAEVAADTNVFDLKKYVIMAITLFLMTIPMVIIVKKLEIIKKQMLCLLLETMILIFVALPLKKMLGCAGSVFVYLIILALGMTLLIHDIYGLIKQKSLKKWWKREWAQFVNFFLVYIFLVSIILALERFTMIINTILVVCILIVTILLLYIGIYYLVCYVQDRCWIKKQPALRSMAREKLTHNMEQLHLKICKRRYVEGLLQNKVELTGQWPENVRPKYEDDKLELILAKLDCIKLESCNYLF